MSLREAGFYVYKRGDKVKGAYLLSRGRLYIELKDGEFFSIGSASSRILFGTMELFIKESAKLGRFFSVRVDSPDNVINVSRAIIEDSLKSFKKSLPISRLLALMLVNLDKIILSKMKEFEKAEALSYKYSEVFSWAVDKLSSSVDLKDKRLYNFYLSKKNTLMYTKGLALGVSTVSNMLFSGSMEKFFVKLDDYKQNVSAGYFLCREGEYGNEFYILLKGTIRVWKGNQVINEINSFGSLLGDMVFWLGARRTASMQALTDIEFIAIKTADIDKILRIKTDFLRFLVVDLSYRVLNHCKRINELNISLNKANKYNNDARVELRRFRSDLVNIMLDGGESEWLLDIKDGIKKRLLSV